MEPLPPPTLDEIHDIVERRQVQARRRSRIAFSGTAAVMAAASVLGIRSLVDSAPIESDPAVGGDGQGEAGTEDPSTDDAPPEEPPPGDATDDERAEADDSADVDADDIGLEDDQFDTSELPASASASVFHLGAFYGAGFGYSQAEALALAWEQDNAWEAKVEAGLLILGGDIEAVESVVGAPLGPDVRQDDFSAGQDQWENDFLHGAFLGAGYSIEQLDRLAAEWSVEPLTAKADAGYDVLTGDTIELDLLIGPPDGRS